MTSRVEAVEKAISDKIWLFRTIDPKVLAQAAIEANDAWLKEEEQKQDQARRHPRKWSTTHAAKLRLEGGQ